MSTERTQRDANRLADHLLDDIHNGIGDPAHLRRRLVALIHADLAGGSTTGTPLRATTYDKTGGQGRRTEHYVDEDTGSRQLSEGEIKAGAVPDWSVTVDPDPVGDHVGREHQDQVHDLRCKATGYAKDAANALHALSNTLAAFAQLRDPNPNPPSVRYCRCAKHREVDNPPVQHTGTVGGRLGEATGLCSDCYEAVRRTAESGTGKGRLPTAEEIQHHDRHGRWRLSSSEAA